MATYAPITYNVPRGLTLSDWLEPEQPDRIYIGPNIAWERLPQNLLTLLELLDPTGMTTTPVGLVWPKRVAPVWRQPIGKNKIQLWEAVKNLGDKIEQAFTVLGRNTQDVPVRFATKMPREIEFLKDTSRLLGLTNSPTKANPKGSITFFPGVNANIVPHEMVHAAMELDDYVRQLADITYKSLSPENKSLLHDFISQGYRLHGNESLNKYLIQEVAREEALPYLFGSQFSSKSPLNFTDVDSLLQFINMSLR